MIRIHPESVGVTENIEALINSAYDYVMRVDMLEMYVTSEWELLILVRGGELSARIPVSQDEWFLLHGDH